MKKNSRFAGFYMGLIFFLMYLPIAVVIVFSFNESKLPVKFTGFSLKWYRELFRLRKAGALVSEEYVPEGLLIHARVEPREMALIKPYIVENNSESENV